MAEPPYQAPLVDASGRVTPGPWRGFFSALAHALVAGGPGASSSAGLALSGAGLEADPVAAVIGELYSMIPPATPAPSFTPGSVIFAGATGGLAQDNASFFFDDTNNVLRVPTIVGGTGVTDDLTLRSTTGVGTINSRIFFQVGNNGSIVACEMQQDTGGNFGRLGIGTPGNLTVDYPLTVFGTGADIGYLIYARAANGNPSAFLQMATGANANAQAGFSFYQRNNDFEWQMAVLGNGAHAMRWQIINAGGFGVRTTLFADTAGNLILDSTTPPASPSAGSKALVFGDGTVPSGLASNTAAVYANDVGGTVQMFAINEAGESTQLSGDLTLPTSRRVLFGGVSATEVALKRSSTALEVRLADDSAYAELRALRAVVDAADRLGFFGRSRVTSPADGNLLLTDDAAATFDRLMFGGSSSSFPALKRAAAVLEAKLADDSAYTDLRAFALRITDGAFLVRAEAALTDGVGAALGTLTTAPTAGDPTKWIPIDDNGTTRYVPAW